MGANLTLPSSNTTWFNFLASHDGIGLNPLRGLLPESEILELVEALQQEGALVNWKNNPDGTRSPYEINVTYMDALSRRESSDEERCARFILAHAILLSFPVCQRYIFKVFLARVMITQVSKNSDITVRLTVKNITVKR